MADFVGNGLGGQASVAGHFGGGDVGGEEGDVAEHFGAKVEGPALAGVEGGVARDGEV